MSFAPGGTPDDFYGPDWRDNAADAGWWNPDDMSQAMTDVFNERFRQWDDEGFSHDHDDKHTNGELAQAAAVYAVWDCAVSFVNRHKIRQTVWPWDWSWWKPKSKRENLVRSTALLLAEIERLDRLEKTTT